jgi:hypothetical protein
VINKEAISQEKIEGYRNPPSPTATLKSLLHENNNNYIFLPQITFIKDLKQTIMSLFQSISKKSPRPQFFVSHRCFAAASGSEESLVKTALNGLHNELGGDMVPFAGYELPVLYKGSDNGGVMKEHLWCRSNGNASLFDVSHMGQVRM